MNRLEIIQGNLHKSTETIWAEPFYEAWRASEGADECLRFAQGLFAEMSSAKPYIKPGELIIGNNALRSIIIGIPTAFQTGIRFEDGYKQALLNDHPESESKIKEIESYWNEWGKGKGRYSPITCHASLAYERILTLGISGMREYIWQWREVNTALRPDCASWYDSLLIVLDGISAFIRNHAIAAERMAMKESDQARRKELMSIASSCYNVSENPPKSFHEAVQLFYLTFWLCGHDSPGPVDRYLYPSLKKDLDGGAITPDQAQEILDCLWLKFEEKTAYGATIGGQLRNGADATNELSFMCINSIKRLRILSPRAALRWHKNLSPELLAFACESVAEGATYPAFVNDEAIIPAMVERGISIEDAREYTFVGCGQVYPHGRGHGNYEDLVLNSAKPIEFALNNGIDAISGHKSGLETGDISTFQTFEEFESAYRQQMDHYISSHINSVNHRREVIKGHVNDLFRSLFTYSCVERGLDWHAGGADYSEGMVDMVGLTTATDSLIAIKKGVFEEKKVSLAEVSNILNNNWENQEQLRLYFLHKMPKFGNDIAEADDYTAEEFSRINEFIKSHKTYFGGPWGMDIIGWSGAVYLGSQTGATPDGRRKGEALADCAGPAQGRNIYGLTPTLISVLKLPHRKTHGPMALSLKFPTKTIKGAEGWLKLQAVVETYFREGGQQLQISIASTEDMKSAQATPEAYRSLMVRVGGFSAYFTQLDKVFQDDMITRSEMDS
jgi:pyruvate-formate lyase